jgi:hypothetical protein
VRRYGVVLFLLAAAFTLGMVQPAAGWALIVTALVQSAAVLAALSRAGVPRSLVAVALLAIAVCVGTAVAALAGDQRLRGISSLASAGTLLLVPIAIAVEFRRDLTITPQTVTAALCIYVVMGMMFASVAEGASALSGSPYFAGRPPADRSDYLYFSYITLATVGYGDFVPALRLGRALAVLEGLMGQVYLVTVVALIVSNLGLRRRS